MGSIIALNISRVLRQRYHVVGLGALPHKHLNNSTFNLLRCISRFIYSSSIRNLRAVKRNIELHTIENNLNLIEGELNYITNSIISSVGDVDKALSLNEGIMKIKAIFDSLFNINHTAFDEILSLINSQEAINWVVGKYLETLSGVSGITINTIHQAKGLEYEVVILNGINEGRIPYQFWDGELRIRHSLTEDNLKDGKTLLYVGLSRAKAILIVLHGWNPSLFIETIKP